MAHILLPNKWRTQPQGNVLLRPEYLGNSRTFIIGSNDLVGADGKPITYSAAKTTYFARGFGPSGYLIGAGTTNVSVNAYTYNKPITVSDPYTLIFFSRLDESKTALTQLVQQSNYSYLSAGDGTNAKVCFAARYNGEGSVTAKITDPIAYTVGADVCYVLTHRPGLQELWRDGILVGSATSTTDLVATSGSALVYAWPSFYLAGVLNKALGSAEAREISRFPYAIVKPHRRVLYFDVGSGVQTLTPSLVTNSQTFHAATVTTGSVNLAPSLVTNSQTFHAATVTAGAVTLAPSLVTNGQTFHPPTVSTGSVTLSPSLVTNGQTFYAPVVANGGVTLAPSLVTNSQTFPSPTISVGAVTLTLDVVVNGQAFYAPTVAQPSGQTLEPTLVTNGQTFYGPTVEGMLLTQADLDAIAAAVWADPAAVAAHAKLDAIIARITC